VSTSTDVAEIRVCPCSVSGDAVPVQLLRAQQKKCTTARTKGMLECHCLLKATSNCPCREQPLQMGYTLHSTALGPGVAPPQCVYCNQPNVVGCKRCRLVLVWEASSDTLPEWVVRLLWYEHPRCAACAQRAWRPQPWCGPPLAPRPGLRLQAPLRQRLRAWWCSLRPAHLARWRPQLLRPQLQRPRLLRLRLLRLLRLLQLQPLLPGR
jgi:hypothetical protein